MPSAPVSDWVNPMLGRLISNAPALVVMTMMT